MPGLGPGDQIALRAMFGSGDIWEEVRCRRQHAGASGRSAPERFSLYRHLGRRRFPGDVLKHAPVKADFSQVAVVESAQLFQRVFINAHARPLACGTVRDCSHGGEQTFAQAVGLCLNVLGHLSEAFSTRLLPSILRQMLHMHNSPKINAAMQQLHRL